jgi:hypothetical protein
VVPRPDVRVGNGAGFRASGGGPAGLEPAVRGVFQKELALLIGHRDEGLMREVFSGDELTSDDPTPFRQISLGP